MEFWAYWVVCAYYKFLGLSKGPTYIWRWLAKCSSSSFYSACGDRLLKQISNIFSDKFPCIFSTWPNWRKVVFFGRGWREWCKVRLPQMLIALSFYQSKKSFSFSEIWIILPLLCCTSPLLEPHTTKYCVDKFCG